MHTPLQDPNKQKEMAKINGTAGKTFFFMEVKPFQDGNFLLDFKTGEKMIASRDQMAEMINQLSLGLMMD